MEYLKSASTLPSIFFIPLSVSIAIKKVPNPDAFYATPAVICSRGTLSPPVVPVALPLNLLSRSLSGADAVAVDRSTYTLTTRSLHGMGRPFHCFNSVNPPSCGLNRLSTCSPLSTCGDGINCPGPSQMSSCHYLNPK